MAAKAAETKALPGAPEEGGKKSSRGKRIVVFLLLLLMILGAAGGAGYWYFYMRTPAVAEAGDKKEQKNPAEQSGDAAQTAAGEGQQAAAEGAVRIERQSDLPRSGGIVVPLPSLTVNLADPAGRRYLKIGMEVELNEDVTAQLQQQAPRVRDAIIMLLAGKNYGDVATPDGKVLLKGEVAARLNQILGAQRVIRVYFTEFVVQ